MRKAVATTLLAGGLTFVPVLDAVHAQDDTAVTDDDDDDNGNLGLIGLAGLLGLAGLAGLKRRDDRYTATTTGTRHDRTTGIGSTRTDLDAP